MHRLAPLAFLSLVTLPLFGACRDTSVDGTTVLEPSDDGLTLQGSYRRQSVTEVVPTLLLMHEAGAGRSRYDFNVIWELLDDQGYNLLAVDLRSHGDSDSAGAIDDLRLNPAGYPIDLLTWLEFLAERAEAGDPVSADRIGVVGLGTSGSLALAAMQTGLVPCAVAISARIEEIDALRPGLPSGGDDDDSAAGDDDDSAAGDAGPLHDVQFMAGSGDSETQADAQALFDAADEPKDLLLVDGPHTGVILLEDFEEARTRTVAWCWGRL